MIAHLHIPVVILFATVVSSFVGCVAPSTSRPLPSGYAAFARYDEPWQKDLLQSAPPEYSHADRAARHQGRGIFHVTLDAQGFVRDVAMRQSTGYSTLDASAVTALRQWRFRPGSWKQLDIPVTFKMARTYGDYIETVRDAQQHQRTL
jgi:TonB family protein